MKATAACGIEMLCIPGSHEKHCPRRIGAFHRRNPGDVVAGHHPDSGGEFVGRITYAQDGGGVIVITDDGREFCFSRGEAAKFLRTIEECDVPIKRGRIGFFLVTEAA